MRETFNFQVFFIIVSSVAFAQPPRHWAKQLAESGIRSVIGVEVDRKGAAYVYGDYTGTVDFDPSAGVVSLTSNGARSLYLLKLNREGSFMWVRNLTGHFSSPTTNLIPNAIQCDGDSVLYLSGRFRSTIDFDPGAGTFTMSSVPANDFNGFVMKIDTSGNFRWAKNIDKATVLAITFGERGACYATGHFFGTSDFDPDISASHYASSGSASEVNAFLLKLNQAGKFQWVKTLTGSNKSEGRALAFDTVTHKCCFVGYAGGGTDIDPGSVSNQSPVNCGFIVHVDTAGNTALATSLPGDCYPAAVIWKHGLVISGAFTNSVDLDPGPQKNVYNSPNGTSGFILKLNTAHQFGWGRTLTPVAAYSGVSGKVMSDKYGNLHLYGRLTGTCDVDPSSGVHTVTQTSVPPPASPYDYLICGFDSAGIFQWAHNLGPCWSNSGNPPAPPGFTTFDGDIYMGNMFSNTIDVDPGAATYTMSSNPGSSIFVERLSSCQGTNVPAVSITSPQYTVCAGETTYLSANGADSYHWSHGPKGAVAAVTPTKSTVYEVMGTDSSGCSGFATYVVLVSACTGLPELDADSGTLYPNPTMNVVTVSAPAGAVLSIYDARGNRQAERVLRSGTAATVDLSALEPGVYFLITRHNGRTSTRRVVKN